MFSLSATKRNKKPNQFVADPSQLKTTTVQRQPSYSYDYQSQPGGITQIRRQTTEQANRPATPTFRTPQDRLTPGDQGMGTRFFNAATIQPGVDLTGSQFPWQMRKGISSDASRQGAFQTGLSSGEGRVGFARKATDTFFDPRYMFDPNFQRWAIQQRQRRQYGF